jgi:esterase/lipase superfamily enzyme
MISNRAIRNGGFLNDRSGHLSFWVNDQGQPHNWANWEPVSSSSFKRLLVTAADQFPLIGHRNQEEQSHINFFVHGYNNTWEDAARRYEQFCTDLFSGKDSLGLCISLAWPSFGSPLGDFPDRPHVRHCGDDFADILSELYDWLLHQQQAALMDPLTRCRAKTSMVAHDIGNYVVQKAMAATWKRKYKPQFGLLNQLLMVAADVDNDLFELHSDDSADGKAIANLASRVTVLYSRRDAVLTSIDTRDFGGQRMGLTGLATQPTDKKNIWDLDCSNLFPVATGDADIHNAYFDNRETLAIMREILRGRNRDELLNRARSREKEVAETAVVNVFQPGSQPIVPMKDYIQQNISGGVFHGQVAAKMEHCTNIINKQPAGEKKKALETLQREAAELIKALPEDKREKATGNLEILVNQATANEPERSWYSLSAMGLLEASKFVKDFTGNIAGTIGQVGKLLWPDFKLPFIENEQSP